jgi:hypothetical protein
LPHACQRGDIGLEAASGRTTAIRAAPVSRLEALKSRAGAGRDADAQLTAPPDIVTAHQPSLVQGALVAAPANASPAIARDRAA